MTALWDSGYRNGDGPSRGHCGYSWMAEGGEYVRCIHTKHKSGRHENGLKYIRVGEETTVPHYWE